MLGRKSRTASRFQAIGMAAMVLAVVRRQRAARDVGRQRIQRIQRIGKRWQCQPVHAAQIRPIRTRMSSTISSRPTMPLGP